MLEYDLIGLQTGRDERNFIASVRSYMPAAEVTGRGDERVVKTQRGTTTLRSIPISIDFKEFAGEARSIAVVERVAEIRSLLPDTELAIGVDRLDYTKGIPERLRAKSNFSDSTHSTGANSVLSRLVVPSREGIPRYLDLRSDIEQLISAINGVQRAGLDTYSIHASVGVARGVVGTVPRRKHRSCHPIERWYEPCSQGVLRNARG